MLGRAAGLFLSLSLACAGLGPSGPAEGSPSKVLVEVDMPEGTRSAWVHVPPGRDARGSLPALFMFHGGTGNNGLKVVDLWKHRAADPWIMVFPNGQLERPTEPGWANGDEVALARDIAFVERLVDEVTRRFRVDPDRRFAAGHSNGANLVYALACRAPDRFAGFAAVSQLLRQTLTERCSDRVRPLFTVQGTTDPKARFEGFEGALSAEASSRWLRDRAGCTGSGVTTWIDAPGDNTRVERTVWDRCTRGVAYERWWVHGGGHSWPGSGNADPDHSRDFSASDEILAFFERVTDRQR